MNCENCGRESQVNPCVDCYPTYKPNNQLGKAEESSFNNPISMKHWLLNMLVLSVPFLGMIMLIVWAIGGGGVSESKKNYARANLVLMIIMTAVVIAFYVAFFAIFFAALGSGSY